MLNINGWVGAIPPQYIYSNRRFLKVALNPPNFQEGSWVGAGKIIYDNYTQQFIFTVRKRQAPPIRGGETTILTSKDGENYKEAISITKEELSKMSRLKIESIEGQQILRDPLTGKLYFYVSIDTGRKWETILLTSNEPEGEWKYEGIVIRCDKDYDKYEARDPNIDIVDGQYIALYKANSGEQVNVALAKSSDGKNWVKLGVLSIDNHPQPEYLQICGNLLPGTRGIMFIGLARRHVINGCGLAKDYESYYLDMENLNLKTIFKTTWKPLSPYEREDYPTHGYFTMTYDPHKNRYLILVEGLDPKHTKQVGWRTQVDRLLLYEVPLDKTTPNQ